MRGCRIEHATSDDDGENYLESWRHWFGPWLRGGRDQCRQNRRIKERQWACQRFRGASSMYRRDWGEKGSWGRSSSRKSSKASLQPNNIRPDPCRDARTPAARAQPESHHRLDLSIDRSIPYARHIQNTLTRPEMLGRHATLCAASRFARGRRLELKIPPWQHPRGSGCRGKHPPDGCSGFARALGSCLYTYKYN